MVAGSIQHISCYHHRRGFGWILISLNPTLVTYFVTFSFSGMFLNGDVVRISEVSSSPRHIIACKGSSVWLHWNYTYIGDGTHKENVHFISKFKEQLIGINNATHPKFQALAKRIGQNGALAIESPVPEPFNGRVEVISSNSTLVIHDVQFRDSTYQFSSDVNVDIDIFAATPVLHDFRLKPIVSLTVIGIPEFITEPSSEVEVSEHSPFELRTEIEGNPRPKAYFKWTQRSSLSVVNASSSRLNAFRYYVTYIMNNVDATFCGKQLQMTLRNTHGSSTTKHISVIVLLKLEQPLNLKAEFLPNDRCVQVNWKKIESAACKVKYLVKLKDVYGKEVNKSHGYNIGAMKMCNILPNDHVADVELTVQFRKVTKTVTVTVEGNGSFSSRKDVFTTLGTIYNKQDGENSTRFQSTKVISKLLINYPAFRDSQPVGTLRSTKTTIYIVIGILAFVAMTVVISMAVILRRMMKASGRRQEQSRMHTQPDSTYMELLSQTNKEKSVYAELVNEYEEIPERDHKTAIV